MNIVIIYDSETGNVKTMADSVAEGAKESGVDVKVIPVEKAQLDDLLNADGIIIGSYTSCGIVSGKIKTLFDNTIKIHKKLQGKVGGAFASSGSLGGGNELTLLSIIQMLLVHGLIIEGDSKSAHFGAVSIGKPDEKALTSAKRLGGRVAELVKKLNK